MSSPWLTSAYGFSVVKSPIGSGSPLKTPHSIVLHTTEGPETSDPRLTFASRGDAPHFAVNTTTIWQTRSLTEWGAALLHAADAPVSPNAYPIQIEICGFSQIPSWLPSTPVLDRVSALVAAIADYHDIPLVVPNPAWKDNCSDMPQPWASNNSRRKWAATSSHWPNTRGVWEHVEVPYQDPTYHWDCGAMGRTVIIAKAKALRGDIVAGEADAALAAFYAEGGTQADVRGNYLYETGRRFGRRNVAIPDRFKTNGVADPDFKKGWDDGQAGP